jgi:dihydrofolate reductase
MISVDGFGAGPGQDLQNPLGVGGLDLPKWFFPTRTFQRSVLGKEDGETGVDDDFAARGMAGIGAWILGRNMFSPSRGPWPDDGWKGWWGPNPPYHVPTFVLTRHAREPIEMEGGTTFHFVTGGIREALDRARAAAGGLDVRVGGGVATIREFLRMGLVDEMHLVVSPVVLGSGEHLLRDIDLKALGFSIVEHVTTPNAMHLVLRR